MARKSTGIPPWFQILESARKLSLNGGRPFTAAALAEAAEIQGTERSQPHHLASGWLSKFVRWGYVLQDGTVPREENAGGRWIRQYRMTKFGLTCEPTGKGQAAVGLKKLVAAARSLQEAYGQKSEALAWREFLRVLEEIDPPEETK
jgi:hypothetical protein